MNPSTIHQPSQLRCQKWALRVGLVTLLAISSPCFPVLATDLHLQPERTHALIIAINDYKNTPKLQGSINDSQDIRSTMEKLGVKDIVHLVDDQVTRERLLKEMDDIINRAKKGDRIFFSYSGHGSQEPERIKGSEADGLDENILLTGFDPNKTHKQGSHERIVDDEIYDWLKKTEKREIDVVMLFDSCHSGTMTRSFDNRTKIATTRGYPPVETDDLNLTLPPDQASPDELKNVISLSGGQDNEEIPEVDAFGTNNQPQKRGALSYYFSRALEGAADTNKDGIISLQELFTYIRSNVRVLAKGRQTPNLLPDNQQNPSLFKAIGSPFDQGLFPDPKRQLPMTVIGMDPVTAKRLVSSLHGSQWVDSTSQAELTWDAGKQDMVAEGDVVAYQVAEKDLPAVIDQQRLMAMLRTTPTGQPLTLALVPNDGRHQKGKQVGLRLKNLRNAYLVLFSLSGDGTLHFHYPLDGDKPRLEEDHLNLDFDVSDPLGVDHFVALVGDAPMPLLITQLKSMNNHRSAGALPKLLREQLQPGTFQFGIQGLYTVP